MKAINKTQNVVIGDKIKVASRPVTRIIGLLTRSSLNSNEGLLILPCKQIHSLFMRFIFDALFLDADGKVVSKIEKMPAWQFSRNEKKATMVLELPPGKIAKQNIQQGDQISFEPEPKRSIIAITLGYIEFFIYITIFTVIGVIGYALLMRLITG